jgi:hypothetical protein
MFAFDVEEKKAEDLFVPGWKRAANMADGRIRNTSGISWHDPLVEIRMAALKLIARNRLGEVYFPLAEYAARTYPTYVGKLGGWEHHWSFWMECMCTGRNVNGWRLEFDAKKKNQYNPDGRYLVTVPIFPPEGYKPVATREEINQLLPVIEAPTEEPDDGGLFDRVMRAMR